MSSYAAQNHTGYNQHTEHAAVTEPCQQSKVEDTVESIRKPVKPTRGVRYIKLGHGGSWEKTCVDRGILRIGFGTADAERFRLCERGRWTELSESFRREGKSKGTVTSFTNQVRRFFEDDGSTLWITFVGERLYWGTLDEQPAQRDDAGANRVIRGGWSCTDIKGEPLTKDRLSGRLTKLAAYQGASCNVKDADADYVIQRINGHKVPQVEQAMGVAAAMKVSTIDLMRLLTPRDFETLVDLDRFPLVPSTRAWYSSQRRDDGCLLDGFANARVGGLGRGHEG